MFVGEAPGRLGAARTGVPFLGDESGRRFERLLAEAGLRRQEVFVTNAVRCLPLDAAGRNRRPRGAEVRECAAWLAAEVADVGPELVVALGTVALDALARVEHHGLVLSEDVGREVAWQGRRLVALYHPGARSAVHRRWEAQVGDWRNLRSPMEPGRS
jgi:DNA polymerase